MPTHIGETQLQCTTPIASGASDSRGLDGAGGPWVWVATVVRYGKAVRTAAYSSHLVTLQGLRTEIRMTERKLDGDGFASAHGTAGVRGRKIHFRSASRESNFLNTHGVLMRRPGFGGGLHLSAG